MSAASLHLPASSGTRRHVALASLLRPGDQRPPSSANTLARRFPRKVRGRPAQLRDSRHKLLLSDSLAAHFPVALRAMGWEKGAPPVGGGNNRGRLPLLAVWRP